MARQPLRATDIIGSTVQNDKGDTLGKVKDIVIDCRG